MTATLATPTSDSIRTLSSLRLIRDTEVPAPDGFTLIDRPSALNPADVAKFMTPFAAVEPTEVLWVLPLDAMMRIITKAPVVVARGTLSEVPSFPREVFRPAILLDAYGIIGIHNHPAGGKDGVTPSEGDVNASNMLRMAGSIIGIDVVDSMIVGPDGSFFSLKHGSQDDVRLAAHLGKFDPRPGNAPRTNEFYPDLKKLFDAVAEAQHNNMRDALTRLLTGDGY